ncbi:CHAD domain-containing protein [Methylopila turkensis]|uniref:Inorganic triphosphatase n=1 Tax=Methylopila turkensis TaxID=1437816 RepID=A0A9W6JS14_9HYPH|nr:CHAD domain-containing protein [Methylopila turkensis]GLK81363.1 inorganic triphosphatase [Methylopila turkensis]
MNDAHEPLPDPAAALEARERELKLEVAPDALGRLAGALRERGAAKRGVAARLVSAYFDSDDRALKRAGVSLRIRRRGRGYVQTIKLGGAGVGMFDRAEWERRARGPELALSPGETLMLASALGCEPSALPALAPVFTTNVKRTVHMLERGAFVVEIALDDAAIELAEARYAFAELEMELLGGTPEELFALARDLGSVAPLRLSALSKSARGYAALDGALGRPAKAGDAPIRPGMTVEEAFVAAATDCVVQFRLNEDVLLAAPEPKAVHQARVALRRLRSAFSLFKPVVSDARSEALRGELKWLAGSLGDARDLDVFAEGRLAALGEGDEPEPGLAALADRVERQRGAAYAAADEALRSPRARGLMLDLAEWLAIGPWRADAETADLRALAIETFAADTLTKRRKKVKKAGEALAALDPHARHQVRIEGKKLRYAADFFADVFVEPKARKRQKTFGKHLTALQEHLGDLNDIATARARVRGLAIAAAAEGDGDAAFAAGAIAGHADADARGLLQAAGKSYAALMKAKPYWR